MFLNNFNFKFQDIQAWNKADVMLVDSIKYDRSHAFTSKDWIVRWGGETDPVFATRVQKM